MQQFDSSLGDDSPGAVLYRQYAPAIFAYLYRELASREEAEDLLLEVFLAALQRKNFMTNGQKGQQAWLWRVASNKVADHYRHVTRHPSVSLNSIAEAIDENDTFAPESVTLKQEEYAHLHARLQDLSELQREVLLLRYGHRLSCAEIATVLGKSEPAIRMFLSRTLQLLRTVYHTQEEGIK
jgi:RNA polymerase sigma-70 factor, ECF subfamily